MIVPALDKVEPAIGGAKDLVLSVEEGRCPLPASIFKSSPSLDPIRLCDEECGR